MAENICHVQQWMDGCGCQVGDDSIESESHRDRSRLRPGKEGERDILTLPVWLEILDLDS